MALIIDAKCGTDAVNDLTPFGDFKIVSPNDERGASQVDNMHSTKDLKVLGIVTLEDAIEEIINEEIIDETDQYIDTRSMLPVARMLSTNKFKRGLTPILGPLTPKAISKYSLSRGTSQDRLIEVTEINENTPLL
eukprot:NODE_495_length_7749_cov_0.107974.p6 type:complete len:135 gc:universal NODE_495_length_7749_cov_0.107974:2377-2781(+)